MQLTTNPGILQHVSVKGEAAAAGASGIDAADSFVKRASGTKPGIIVPEVRMDRTISHSLLYAAAALSLIAALIHVWVMPEHFAEWWGYGLFFLVAAAAQALFAVLVVKMPSSTLLRAGIVGNLAIIAFWAVTRTIGIPFFGPHAGEIEAVGALDVASKLAELLLVVLLVVLLRKSAQAPRLTASVTL